MCEATFDQPLWCFFLFVPATAERFVANAYTRGADTIIIDLEDAVVAIASIS